MVRYFLLAGALVLSGCNAIEQWVAPDAELLSPAFLEKAQVSAAEVDYAGFDAFLAEYHSVDARGFARVNYAALGATGLAEIEAVVDALEKVDPSNLARDDQLAYWLNLYNAETIRVVAAHYPVTSIRDIGEGFLALGPWGERTLEVAGWSLSLNDIEHGIVRPIYGDPRIHYALNCAAISCPNLAPRAWRGETLDEDLASAEHEFLHDERGISVSTNGQVTVSKIFLWFEEDFGDDLYVHLLERVEGPVRAALKTGGEINGYAYDWSLNEVSPLN